MQPSFPIPVRLAVATTLAVCSLAVSAQQTADVASRTQIDAAVAMTETVGDTERKPEVDRNCLRETGSRVVEERNDDVPRSDQPAPEADADTKTNCTIGNGRVYTREDLDRTGHATIKEALKALDPSIR